MPTSNTEYWSKKINGNVERDKSNIAKLESIGWKVFIIWECQLKKTVREENLSNLYQSIIKNKKPQ